MAESIPCSCFRHRFSIEPVTGKQSDTYVVDCPECQPRWAIAFLDDVLAAVAPWSEDLRQLTDNVMLQMGGRMARLYSAAPAYRVAYATAWQSLVRWRASLPTPIRLLLRCLPGRLETLMFWKCGTTPGLRRVLRCERGRLYLAEYS